MEGVSGWGGGLDMLDEVGGSMAGLFVITSGEVSIAVSRAKHIYSPLSRRYYLGSKYKIGR